MSPDPSSEELLAMFLAEHYRRLAATIRARAQHEDSGQLAADWEHLAQYYSRLAGQTDWNDTSDATCEPARFG
jgi:hypothetical protein